MLDGEAGRGWIGGVAPRKIKKMIASRGRGAQRRDQCGHGAARLEAAHPLFRGLPAVLARAHRLGAAALAPGDAPLHPAAARAFRDAGLLA